MRTHRFSSPDTRIEFPVIEINFELSRSDIESVLTGFLPGALGVSLVGRLDSLSDLPREYRTYLQLAEGSGSAWIWWSTPSGAIAAWGRLDLQGSRRINACLLHIDWCDTLTGRHSLWCYCDPQRPTEWTIGRGRQNEPG
jgi:hypothetical protein